MKLRQNKTPAVRAKSRRFRRNLRRSRQRFGATLLLVFLALPVTTQDALPGAGSETSAELSFTQTIIPHEIYTGDTVTIQLTFTDSNLYPVLFDDSALNDEIELTPSDALRNSVNPENAFIKSARIAPSSSAAGGFTLFIELIPWKPGPLSFGKLNLAEAFIPPPGGDAQNPAGVFAIELSPIEVHSISQRLNARSIRPPVSPILLPKTNYYLWLFSILGVLAISTLFTVILKAPLILRYLRRVKRRIALFINAQHTKRLLSAALKHTDDDKTFAGTWQEIMRKYLSFRFSAPCASVPASKIALVIPETDVPAIMAQAESLCAAFTRTDYIRFAAGSIDSKLLPEEDHKAGFAPGERELIVSKAFEIIDCFESNEGEKQDSSLRRQDAIREAPLRRSGNA